MQESEHRLKQCRMTLSFASCFWLVSYFLRVAPFGSDGTGKTENCLFIELGDRPFFKTALKLWNDLPLLIRNISSVNSFKKSLKTLSSEGVS